MWSLCKNGLFGIQTEILYEKKRYTNQKKKICSIYSYIDELMMLKKIDSQSNKK